MKVDVVSKNPVRCHMIVRNVIDGSIGLKALDCSIVILKSASRQLGAVINSPNDEWVLFNGTVTLSND